MFQWVFLHVTQLIVASLETGFTTSQSALLRSSRCLQRLSLDWDHSNGYSKSVYFLHCNRSNPLLPIYRFNENSIISILADSVLSHLRSTPKFREIFFTEIPADPTTIHNDLSSSRSYSSTSPTFKQIQIRFTVDRNSTVSYFDEVLKGPSSSFEWARW